MSLRVVVQEGPIKINHVCVVSDHEDVKVLRADLKAKYAAVAGGCDQSIDLKATARTIGADKSARDVTTVEFQGLDESWHVEAAMTGKYTVTFLLLRQASETRHVWP